MKNYYFLLVALLFFSCTKKEHKQPLNKLSSQEFEQYIKTGLEKNKSTFTQFVDSIANLPNLKTSYKGKTARWQAENYILKKQLDSALLKNKQAFAFTNDNTTKDIVSNYEQLARISQSQGFTYKAMYYFNKVAETLLKTNIYTIPPHHKADRLLLTIAYENKFLNHTSLANKYINGALAKAKTNKTDSVTLSFIYQIKGGLFATKNNTNKDSLFYYFKKATNFGKTKIKQGLDRNLTYAKAELYYNTNELDSCLYYMSKLPKEATENSLVDEINLLTLYSKKGMLKKADKVFNTINNSHLTQADSLLYLENVTDYYMYKGKYAKMKKALNNFLTFHSKYYLQESNKNLKELSTIIDLQQKDFKIKNIEQKISVFERLSQRKNLLIALVTMLLITVLAIAMYLKNKSAKKQLLLENEQVKLKNKTTELKMKLLQSQINPHFIFNTLATIQSQIRLGKNEESIHYLNNFSKLMRETLELSRSSETTLQKELLIVDKYIELQQLRNNNFTFKKIISEEIKNETEDIYLPALTLQPFIENAILHGFKGIEYKGEIELKVQTQNNNLYITITDNGCGLKANSYSKNHTSHGINIIKESLEILEAHKKNKSLLTIKNRTNSSGVIVTLKIPSL